MGGPAVNILDQAKAVLSDAKDKASDLVNKITNNNIRIYYQIVDCGDDSYSLKLFKSEAELNAAIVATMNLDGYAAEQNGTYVDIDPDDYQRIN